MSSAVVSTSAALSRPFVFDGADTEVCQDPLANKRVLTEEFPHESAARILQSTLKNQQSTVVFSSIGNRQSAIENFIVTASQLQIRPVPEMVASGIPAIDVLTGGLPRGCLTEICGPASSGRTSVLLAALAAATRRGEFCALVDADDSLDPQSAVAAGIELNRLLWVRCGEEFPPKSFHPKITSTKGSPAKSQANKNNSQAVFDFASKPTSLHERRLEQVLRATDLLLESGGFGLIVLDLSDLPPQAARRIPLTTWFRFRRAIEHTPTMMLAIEQHAIAGSCSTQLLRLAAPKFTAADEPQASSSSHTHLFTGLEINVELSHSRLERKPARSITFVSKTAWAG
jgi:hypothetical protein